MHERPWSARLGDDGNDDDTADAGLVLLAFCTRRLVSMTESTIEYVLWISNLCVLANGGQCLVSTRAL